jgi:hypothetical protein
MKKGNSDDEIESEYMSNETGSDSDSDVDSGDDGLKFRNLFALWALTWGIKQNAVDALLGIFRLFHWGLSLPKTARTLLKTPRKVSGIKSVPPGKYFHFGILNSLLRVIRSMPVEDIPPTIEILINIDGIPISKSSGDQFWPILGKIWNGKNQKVFIIGLYCGIAKPESCDIYLADFVAEAQELEQNGFSFKGKHYQFKMSAFACDTPARSFILNIKGHTGYFGCPKCIQQGDYEGRVVFLERNAPLRTYESFRNRIHEDHHNGDSILELLDLDMV